MKWLFIGLVCAAIIMIGSVEGQEKTDKDIKRFSYKKDIIPILKKYCLPCHLKENENPSNLSMDTYELILKGGQHGASVVPKKPENSSFWLKLSTQPPFGKQMPAARRKLSADEVKLIYDWIAQGAPKE